MLFVGTSIIHPSTDGVFLLCNILDLLIYSYKQIISSSDTNVNVQAKKNVSFLNISALKSVDKRYKRIYNQLQR